jgi:hypothetical protein
MEGEGETRKGPSYSDHGGLVLRRGPAHGRGGGIAQCALTSARLAEERDGGGRGVPGGAMDGVWVVAMRQRACAMAVELAAMAVASFLPRRARREEEGRNEGRSELWMSW